MVIARLLNENMAISEAEAPRAHSDRARCRYLLQEGALSFGGQMIIPADRRPLIISVHI
jgi:hypothetical protein